MFKRIIKVFSVASLLASPAVAQFGVKKKQGGTFQEMQEQAQGMAAGGGAMDPMAALANMDPDDMMKLIQEGMNDPATQQYLQQMGTGMQEVMDQLAKMSPEEMMQQVTQGLSQMASPETLNSVIEQKDEVLASLKAQGLITDEQMAEFQADPAKFQEQMTSAFSEMNKILEDPEALESAMKMMGGMMDVMKDPSAAMGKLADLFNAELGDDTKIEEARLQLLADPALAGNPAFGALFENEDMQEILKDPVKWREEVKKGQAMLTGQAQAGGAAIGEL